MKRLDLGSERLMRAVVIVGLLIAVVGLAFFRDNQQAQGACIGGLGLAISFLFRGKVQPSDSPAGGGAEPPK